MPLPRPASPRLLWADIRAFAAQRSRYQWVSLALALLMPAALVWMFFLDSAQLKPQPRVIYVESWPASRTDGDIAAAQQVRQRERAARDAEIRRRWKQLGDRTGVNP